MEKLKDFRCQNCHNLQFKYAITRDALVCQVKCYSCNTFNTLTINLSSLLPLLQQIKELEDEKGKE